MFNDNFLLTKAVLEGRKTQTRRFIPQDFFSLVWDKIDDTLVYENGMGDFIDVRNSKYAQFKVGEIVAVAQRYRECDGFHKNGIPRWEEIAISVGAVSAGWDNKMFVRADLMSHQILITDVWVERLQDISAEDCLKEGIEEINMSLEQENYRYCFYDNTKELWDNYRTPQEAFAHLINRVSRKDVWKENPYVFVYDFELIK